MLPRRLRRRSGSRPSTPPVESSVGQESPATLPRAEAPEATPVPDGLYGDFGGLSYTMTDFVEVTRRTVECMKDHGFSVEVIPPGDGISYANVPQEQNAVAVAQSEECERSMAVPAWTPPSADELRVVYEYNVALKACLADLGFTTTPAPSFEVFAETYLSGPWTAYFGSNMSTSDVETRRTCPEVPPGGFAAWSPGDQVDPLP